MQFNNIISRYTITKLSISDKGWSYVSMQTQKINFFHRVCSQSRYKNSQSNFHPPLLSFALKTSWMVTGFFFKSARSILTAFLVVNGDVRTLKQAVCLMSKQYVFLRERVLKLSSWLSSTFFVEIKCLASPYSCPELTSA